MKTFLISVVRNPISFILFTYAIPLGILAILLNIPNFLASSNKFGTGSPTPIKNFAGSLHKKLVIVKPPYLGPDADHVIEILTKPLDRKKLVFLDNETALTAECQANLPGVTGCHASITFIDTPLTEAKIPVTQSSRHTWQYTIRGDPAWDSSRFDATSHKSNQEDLYLPLQLAVNNAITNSTATPDILMYTRETQESQDRAHKLDTVTMVGRIYVFGLFACYLVIIYRFASFMTDERESGMSQLVDGMGGGGVTVARVLSWLIVYDIACLPCFIVFGVLYWFLMFPTSSVGLLIGWQVMLGLAVNSSTVFAASFFTKSRVSAIYIIGAFLVLAVGAQVYSFSTNPKPQSPGVYALSAMFPSSNHVFFAQQMCLWELDSTSAAINRIPEAEKRESTLTLIM